MDTNAGRGDLGGFSMTAFDAGWAVLKMPLYHGTRDWEGIQRDGYLMPTDEPPDLNDYTDEGLVDLFGSEEEVSRLFDGDWSFAYGDKAPMSAGHLGGRLGAIANAGIYHAEDGNPVLEILDEDAHILEPTGYNSKDDQRRTRYPIPISRIRALSQEEVQDAINAQYAHQDQAWWLRDVISQMPMTKDMTDDEIGQLLRFKTMVGLEKPLQYDGDLYLHPYWSGRQTWPENQPYENGIASVMAYGRMVGDSL